MSEENFSPLTHMNVDCMYSSGFLKKGALVKYRLSKSNILDYGLNPSENEWSYGLISETHWYINMSIINIYPEKTCVCYDIHVHNVTLSMKEMINIEQHEIFVLTSE